MSCFQLLLLRQWQFTTKCRDTLEVWSVGFIVIVLLQIFYWLWQWKKFENRTICDEGAQKIVLIFWPPCISCPNINDSRIWAKNNNRQLWLMISVMLGHTQFGLLIVLHTYLLTQKSQWSDVVSYPLLARYARTANDHLLHWPAVHWMRQFRQPLQKKKHEPNSTTAPAFPFGSNSKFAKKNVNHSTNQTNFHSANNTSHVNRTSIIK